MSRNADWFMVRGMAFKIISLCAPTIGLYENSNEKKGNLKEGDLSTEITNHSQRIFTSIQIIFFDFSMCHVMNVRKTQKNMILD